MKTYLLTFKLLVLSAVAIQPQAASAQTSIADARTGCRIRMISVGDSPPTVRWDGACVAGFASGVGTVVFDSGIRYTGEMRDGWRNGQGKISFPDGNNYEGAFVNSRFNGRGLYVFSNGQRIEGQFKDGDANGACEITMPNRTRISGQCVDGEVVGQGTAVFPDGGRYDGGYAGSQQSGQGVYVGPNRQFRQEGTFREGKFVSGRAYIADDSYQNIENGRPVGDMVPSPATQARMLLNVLATAAVSAQNTTKNTQGAASSNSTSSAQNNNSTPVSSANASNNQSSSSGKTYLDRADNCVSISNTKRESIAQWYRVTNKCSTTIKFFSAPNSDSYGSLSILQPGQSSDSWYNATRLSTLPWVACPGDPPSGRTVSVEGNKNSPNVNCYFRG